MSKDEALKYLEARGYDICPRPEGQSSGLFGYQSAMIHRAATKDDVGAMRAMMDAGWINKDSKTLFNHSMPEYCRNYGGIKCAEIFA